MLFFQRAAANVANIISNLICGMCFCEAGGWFYLVTYIHNCDCIWKNGSHIQVQLVICKVTVKAALELAGKPLQLY